MNLADTASALAKGWTSAILLGLAKASVYLPTRS
jgi:hypothetical protein